MSPSPKQTVQKKRGDEARKKPINPSTAQFHILRLKKGLRVSEVADAIGMGRAMFGVQLAQERPIRTLRFKVEALFGVPIWSSTAEFKRGEVMRRFCGCDPRVLRGRREMRELGRRHGVPIPARATRAEMIEMLSERAKQSAVETK